MSLIKNYSPLLSIAENKKIKPDAYFPFFLPAYKKIEGEVLAELLYYDTMSRYMAFFHAKNYAPRVFEGYNKEGYSTIFSKSKTPLSLTEQLRRLSIDQQKISKKNQQILDSIFFDRSYDLVTRDVLGEGQLVTILNSLVERGVLKRSKEQVYRDIATQAIVHPDKIEWREEQATALEVKCFVETKNDVFPLIVEDPLLFFSDLAIIVHENDKRYKKHIGKRIILPLINKSIPIYGEKDIDTVKNNGIIRVNPLLDEYGLRKAEELGLATYDSHIDDKGNFSEWVVGFSGKAAGDFIDNIVETIDTIGNLGESKAILIKKPFSRETGNRLIPKIVDTLVVDIEGEKEFFLAWLTEHFPDLVALFSEEKGLRLSLEDSSPFSTKLVYAQEAEGVRFLDLDSFSQQTENVLAKFVMRQTLLGFLEKEVALEELLDMAMIRYKDHQNRKNLSTEEQLILKTFKKWFSGEKLESLIDEFVEECSTVPWLQLISGTTLLKINKNAFIGDKKLSILACDDIFLKSLAYIAQQTKQEQIWFQHPRQWGFKDILIIKYLLGDQQSFNYQAQHRFAQTKLPTRVQAFANKEGRDAIRWSFLHGEERKIDGQRDFDAYSKHLWNLYRLLAHKSAFKKTKKSDEIQGLDAWIYTELQKITQKLHNQEQFSPEILVISKELTQFTQQQFSRYIELLKSEDMQDSWEWAGMLFLDILAVLAPFLPHITQQIQMDLACTLPNYTDQEQKTVQKDYQIQLLFDIIAGVFEIKKGLQLKKHIATNLVIKTNTQTASLLQKYEEALRGLLKAKEIRYLTANEDFESNAHVFSILDMQIGITFEEKKPEVSLLFELEQQLKDKKHYLEHLRGTLMALSLSPSADPQKVSVKEKELELLKHELEVLDIKIRKLKMKA